MAFGKVLRLSTKAALGGGTIYFYYNSGLWRNPETTIENYEKLRKETSQFLEANPRLVTVLETAQSHSSSTVAPVVDAVSNFRKEWLDFDLYWIGSGDGIIKPVWNKSISWVCDFLAHAPEDLKYITWVGWEKVVNYTTEANTAIAKPK